MQFKPTLIRIAHSRWTMRATEKKRAGCPIATIKIKKFGLQVILLTQRRKVISRQQ